MRSIILALACFVTTSAVADDWPQWMGKIAINRWNAKNIVEKFPDGGPKIVWRSPIAADTRDRRGRRQSLRYRLHCFG